MRLPRGGKSLVMRFEMRWQSSGVPSVLELWRRWGGSSSSSQDSLIKRTILVIIPLSRMCCVQDNENRHGNKNGSEAPSGRIHNAGQTICCHPLRWLFISINIHAVYIINICIVRKTKRISNGFLFFTSLCLTEQRQTSHICRQRLQNPNVG